LPLPLLLLRPITTLALALAACAPGDRTRAEAAQDTSRAAVQPEPPRVPPLRTDSAGRAWVEQTLAGLTLRQKVAQLVFPWISGQSASANSAEHERMLAWVTRDEVGGLIVSTGTPAAVATKLNAAQMRAGVPLLVVSDLETGAGMRLSPGGTVMPPAMAFSAAGDTALARQAGRATAAEARAVGIHMTLGPLFDVNSNPANPIINVRSFGESPEQVARMGTAWMRGARDGGLLSVGKHFPGHGDTHVDSHVGLAQTGADSTRLRTVEMAPFATAVQAGIDGILVGHIAVVGLEGPGAAPASLSPRIIGGELRGRLGFGGLVFTDALNMGGVTRSYSVSEAAIRALLAGADVLLQPPGHEVVIDRIVAAVESGRIPAARIDEAARRVLTAKAAAGLHRGARVDPSLVAEQVGTDAHRQTARRVAEGSITLVRDGGGLVPLRPGARVLHVTYTETGRRPRGRHAEPGARGGRHHPGPRARGAHDVRRDVRRTPRARRGGGPGHRQRGRGARAVPGAGDRRRVRLVRGGDRVRGAARDRRLAGQPVPAGRVPFRPRVPAGLEHRAGERVRRRPRPAGDGAHPRPPARVPSPVPPAGRGGHARDELNLPQPVYVELSWPLGFPQGPLSPPRSARPCSIPLSRRTA
jgi:beta-N-acetylhexosaminidase